MNRFIFLLIAVGIYTTGIVAQELPAPERHRLLQGAPQSTNEEEAKEILETRKYVIPADRLDFYGYPSMGMVSSTTNFLKVDGDRGVIQIEPQYNLFDDDLPGMFTYVGTIYSYKKKVSKNGDISLRFSMSGFQGNIQVSITQYKGGAYCHVIIDPIFEGPTLTLSGKVIPLDAASVFEGGASLSY